MSDPTPRAKPISAAQTDHLRRARAALDATFPDDETRRAYYRQIGERSNAGRLVLTVDETQQLAAAYDFLSKLAARARAKTAASLEPA